MFVIGDVLATIAIFFGIGLMIWATALVAALLWPEHAIRSAKALQGKAAGTFGIGLAVFAPVALIAIGLLAAPSPPAKVLGFVVAGTLLLFSSLGFGSLGYIVGDRIQEASPDTSAWVARTRGLALLTIAASTPIVGWFVLGPVLLILALGASVRSLAKPKVQPEWPANIEN
ncbi:MAG: hypothetical protein KF812_11445 [Fimbriimonadaceae bacterium]|nr:hypothetical protein [Fimbriimonadaceae bacterium]